jgi:hypothetical protein
MSDAAGPIVELPEPTPEDRAYLAEIADVLALLPSIEEARALARGCPDPDRYADEDLAGL